MIDSDLQRDIDETLARLDMLKRRAATATCAQMGAHDMKSTGGANCGCPDGTCSVPVNACTRCGDCDYGDNVGAREQRAHCAATRDIPEDVYFSIANDNFYSVPVPGGEASKGQGNEFFRYWKPRWRAFPPCDCQCVPTHISIDCPIHGLKLENDELWHTITRKPSA